MAFDIFPDPATAAALGKPAFAPLPLAPGEAMRAFVPLPRRAGPDPPQGGASTCFVRIAGHTEPDDGVAAPTVELAAGDPARRGSSPQTVDPAQAYSFDTGVRLYDGLNPTSAAIAYFDGPAPRDVYLLKILLEIADTQIWMRLVNRNPDACEFVWVVADSDEDSRQPWVIALSQNDVQAPAAIRLDAYVGQPVALNAEPLVVLNRGSGPVTVVGVDPPLPAPFVMRGLPLTVAAGSRSQALDIGVDRPSETGDLGPTWRQLVTRDKPDPGPFGPRHNDQFSLSARVGENVWKSRKPMPTPRESLGVVSSRAGDVYALCGENTTVGGISNAVERYVVATDTWTFEPPAPTARYGFGTACASDGTIYLVGGVPKPVDNIPKTTTLNEAFDPVTKTWRTLAPMPTPRSGLVLVAAGDGLLYAIGGYSLDGAAFDVVEAYDPQRDKWTRRRPMPTARFWLGGAKSDDGRIFAVGGRIGSSNMLDANEAYDPATNVWTSLAPMPTKRDSLGFVSGRNGRLYAIGGSTESIGWTDATEVYDPAANMWRKRAPMPTPRALLGLAVTQTGRILAIGGIKPAVEEYTP